MATFFIAGIGVLQCCNRQFSSDQLEATPANTQKPMILTKLIDLGLRGQNFRFQISNFEIPGSVAVICVVHKSWDFCCFPTIPSRWLGNVS